MAIQVGSEKKQVPEKCRLVRAEIHDFMRVRFVELKFGEDPIIPIQGRNEQGKTSVLRAFVALLGGKDASPEKPIREGAESAQVLAELDNGLVVRRRWTAAGNTYLDVQTKEGASFKRPQEILEQMVGRFTLDPLEFDRMDAKKQAETLRRIAGVDLAPFETRRKELYDERTLANRNLASLKAQLGATPEVDAPEQLQSAAELTAEQERRLAVKRENDSKRAALRVLHARFEAAQTAQRAADDEVARLRKALEAAEERAAAAAAQVEDLRQKGRAEKAAVDALADPDLGTIVEQLREIEATNERVRRKRARAELAERLAAAETESKRLDDAIAAVDSERAAALTTAKFPIDGLGFDAEGVTFQGIPYKQASHARRIRISTAIALALRPRLPLVAIQDGSVLDDGAREIVRSMAAEAGAHVLLELVGKGGGGIVIEDGFVEGAAAPAEAGHG